MENAQTIRRSLDQGMWVFFIDLKDASFHIPIHPPTKTFLRICTGNRVFQFKALPFRISSAPWLFIKIFQQLAMILGKKYIAIHQYLDNWLNKQWSREKSLQDRQKTLLLCQQMGCLINWDKSELDPTQQLDFVGVHFNLLEGTVQPATEKMDRLLTKVFPFLHNLSVPAQAWESLLGLLNQLEAYVPWGKIHIRPIQQNLLLSYSPQRDPHDLPIPVWKDTREAIQWWRDRENFYKGCPIHQSFYQYRICSDTSMEGWVAHMDQCRIYGSWSQQEQSLHINILEMRAIRYALIRFNLPTDSVILVNSDNSTVVAYVNKQGGTRSVTLMEETYLLFHLLQEKQWFLRASYLPGARNVIADSLSRQNQILPSEWSLHPSIVQRILRIWDFPVLDLFVTRRNRKLPLYVCPVLDDQAWAEDASVNMLDRFTSICISSHLHYVQSAGKDSCGKLPSSTDCSSMADPVLVLSSAGNVRRSSTQTFSVTKVTETDGQTILPLKFWSPKSSCLEAARSNLQKQGFSQEL